MPSVWEFLYEINNYVRELQFYFFGNECIPFSLEVIAFNAEATHSVFLWHDVFSKVLALYEINEYGSIAYESVQFIHTDELVWYSYVPNCQFEEFPLLFLC